MFSWTSNWDIIILFDIVLMSLLALKLSVVSFIHTILLLLVILTRYKKKFKFLNSINYLILANVLLFSFFYIIFNFFWRYDQITTYFVNAAFLSIWYIELAIYLEKYFWRDFLQNTLPFSLNFIVSLTLMINAGYFTLLFILKILQSESFF